MESLTLNEASERLRLSSQTVRSLIKDGKIPAIKLGRSYRIPRRAVDALAAGLPVPPDLTKG